MNREDLQKYKHKEDWIKDRMDYLEEYNSKINKLTATISDMMTKASKEVQDAMAEKIAVLMDYSNVMLDEIILQQKKQTEIRDRLSKVEQPYQNILFEMYILGKTLVKIADEKNYSYVDICRKHGIALNKFDNVI